MSELDYKPNSHKYREEQRQDKEKEERHIEKVVSKPAKTKKNELRKFAGVFISEDVSNVKSYVLMDVLVPAIKKAISDIITNGIDMILYGESGRNKKAGSSKVSYRNYYDQKNDHPSRDSGRPRPRFDYDDIVFDNRGEAEAVLDEMNHVIQRYGFVTVADMYDMAELTQPYTSNRYGWMSLGNSEVLRVRDGYILKLPKASPID